MTWLRRRFVTLTVAAVTIFVTALQLVAPVLALLQRDGAAVASGQWWRLATSMLVHGQGVAHLLFNVAGIVLVGFAVESWAGPLRWLAFYLVGGVGAGFASFLLFPAAVDSGASGGVAGLIGALAVHMARTRELPWWPAWLYAGFFAAYLAGLGWGGVVAGAVAGSVVIAGSVTLRRAAGARVTALAVVAVIGVGAAALAVRGDVHGFGLLIGAGLGVLLGPRAHADARADDG